MRSTQRREGLRGWGAGIWPPPGPWPRTLQLPQTFIAGFTVSTAFCFSWINAGVKYILSCMLDSLRNCHTVFPKATATCVLSRCHRDTAEFQWLPSLPSTVSEGRAVYSAFLR